MSEPQKPEDNPYLASQVADVPLSEGNKTPGPFTIIAAILIGGVTAVVTFGLTFFFTGLGLTGDHEEPPLNSNFRTKK